MLLVPCFLLGSAGLARCDEITFANGEHLTGKLVSAGGGVIAFQSDRLGILHFPVANDLSLVVSGSVVIRTTDGKQYEGTMRAGAGEGWKLATEDNTQMVMISPGSVASIVAATPGDAAAGGAMVVATRSRENVWRDATDRPRLMGPWTADSTFALSGANATKSRRLVHWNGELDNTTGLGTFKLTAERVYSTSTNQAGKQFIDDDSTRGEANYAKNVSARTSVYVDFEGLHDAVSSIDKRLDFSGGATYHVLAKPKVNLTASVGPAFIHYAYLPNQNVTAPSLSFGAVQFGYTSSLHLPGKIVLHHDFRFDEGTKGDGSYLSFVNARVKRPITHWLYLDGKVSDDFNSKAAYKAKQNTLRYSAGIGVSFNAF